MVVECLCRTSGALRNECGRGREVSELPVTGGHGGG